MQLGKSPETLPAWAALRDVWARGSSARWRNVIEQCTQDCWLRAYHTAVNGALRKPTAESTSVRAATDIQPAVGIALCYSPDESCFEWNEKSRRPLSIWSTATSAFLANDFRFRNLHETFVCGWFFEKRKASNLTVNGHFISINIVIIYAYCLCFTNFYQLI